MKKAYVSSTFNDLQDYREEIRKTLRRHGIEDVAMEYYVAEDKRPVYKCLTDIDSCDIYIGIYAWRYGWVPQKDNEEQLSITEMEYRRADSKKIQCFIFFLDENQPWPPKNVDDDKTAIKRLRDVASEEHGGVPFTTIDNLGNRLSQALTNLKARRDTATSTPDSFFPEKYSEKLLRRFGRLDLEGLTPPDRDDFLQVELQTVFVEPYARENSPPLDFPKDLLEKLKNEGEIHEDDLPKGLPLEEVRRVNDVYYEKPPVQVLSIIAEKPYTIILGDPGSGKSTLSRYVLLSLIDVAADNVISQQLKGYIPILIELRSYVAQQKKKNLINNFIDFIDYLSEAEGFYPNKKWLKEFLSGEGRCIVIFDGLDEIFDPEERNLVARQIVGFKEQYPNVKILATSRVIGYKRKILTDGGFEHYTLQDLNRKQVEEFIAKWYSIALRNNQAEASIRCQRIMQAIDDSPSIRQLSGNLMLLTIMAIIAKNQELPRERWKVYHHAASVLIQQWDINRHLRDNSIHIDFIGEDDKREVLRRLAFFMQGRPGGLAGNYIEQSELQRQFESYLEDQYQSSPERRRIVATLMIRQFRERNFILSSYGPGLYGFVHRGFLEFFCANAIVNKFEKTREITSEELTQKYYGEHWHDQSWHEVLKLISGLIDNYITGQIVDYLSKDVNTVWKDQSFKNPPVHLSLALKCLVEIRNITRLAAPCSHLLKEIFEVFERDMQSTPVHYSFMKNEILPNFESLGPSWAGKQDVLNFLEKWNSSDQESAFSFIYDKILGTCIGHICKGDSTSKSQLIAYASEAHPKVRVLLPFALAVAWPDDEAVWSLIIECANNDRFEQVSYAAIYALAEHASRRPGTLEFLKHHATENPHAYGRSAAISGLVNHFAEDAEVFEILYNRVPKEESKYPRTALVKALGDYFWEREETFGLFLRLAKNDPSPKPEDRRHPEPYYVREAAVEYLCRYWPKHTEVINLLHYVAENDSTAWMKLLAIQKVAGLNKFY